MPRPSSRSWHRLRLRWFRGSPGLRLAVQSILIAIVAVSGYAVANGGDVISETAASVLVATVFGTTTVVQLRQSQRRQHTVQLISNIQATQTLCEADTWMAKRIAAHRPVHTDATAAELGHVIVMLDYYEFLSSLAIRGFVDSRLLVALRGGTMMRCFEVCRDYIAARRDDLGPDLYRSFELLVAECARRSPTPGYAPLPRPPADPPLPKAAPDTVERQPD